MPGVLTNRLGPLPVWAWVLLGGVAGGITLRLLRRGRGDSTAAGAASVVDGQTADGGGYTPDASGYYADTGSTGGSVSGGGGAVSGGGYGSGDVGVSPDTGFGTVAAPASPVPPPEGYAYDGNGQLQPKDIVQAGMIFGILDDLAAGGYTVSNGQVVPIAVATPASPTTTTVPPDAPYSPPQAPAPVADAPYVPPPPAYTPSPATAAPTTSPTAHTTLAPGTVLWKGDAAPNLATIATRWGVPQSALKVSRPGPAYGVNYVVTYAP